MQQRGPVRHGFPCVRCYLRELEGLRDTGRTWARYVRAALLPNVRLISQPLDCFGKGIHVGKLEDVDGHDDLVIS